MTDLFLVLSFVAFLAIGLLSPFVMALGYVWVDMFLPHRISDALLQNVPVALILAAATLVSYLVMDRKTPPRPSALLLLYLALAIWITLTTTWAVAPGPAWYKWDPSFKTLLFAAFLPFVFRTRVQIEAFVLVLIFASSAHILPWGLKTIISGGGYGRSLGQLGSNQSFLSESSSIAAICFAFAPFFLFFARQSVILPQRRAVTWTLYAFAGIYALGAVGTFARVALVGLTILFVGLWIQARRRTWFTIAAVIGLLVVSVFTTAQWTARINTTADFQTESSAATRVAVWRWTWNFVQSNPLGGGFNAFIINRIETPTGDPMNPQVQFARAFHNIYFAALGEHGFPGLLLYGSILGLTLHSLGQTRKRLKGHPEHGWASDMASAGRLGLLVLMGCAFFIDLSFNPVLWNMLGLGLCLQEYARRALYVPPLRLGQTEDEFLRRRPASPVASPVAARLT